MSVVTIARNYPIEDDGSGTSGDAIDNDWLESHLDDIDAALALLLPLAGGTMTGNLSQGAGGAIGAGGSANASYSLYAYAAVRMDSTLIVAGSTTLSGTTYIGDTSNANITLGLTINQGAADNQILALKSSDIAHGCTGVAETDTYGYFQKDDGNSGCMRMEGISEGNYGLIVSGLASTADTTKSTGALAAVIVHASLISGTSRTTMSANSNMMVIRDASSGNARFIFDAEGDSHEDGTGWTAYDDHDDIALIESLEFELTSAAGNPIDRHFSAFLQDQRPHLERLGLVTFNADGHHFVNRSRMQNLLCGAVRQLARQMVGFQKQLAQLGA